MRLAATLLCMLLAACGFQLRGTADVPFQSIYVGSATAGSIGLDLKRNIAAGTRAKVVDSPKDAEAILVFTEEAREREILSLTATGRVSEFKLRYRVGFRVHDGKGTDFVPTTTVVLFRDVTFSDSAVLAKETEEGQLYRDMQNDMVQQIMRRLSAAHKPAPRVQ